MKKALAIQKRNSKIIFARGYSNYATTSSYATLLNICKREKSCIFELVFADVPVPMYFDLESKDIECERAALLFADFKTQLNNCFCEYNKTVYILESHGEIVNNTYTKYSLHVICRLFNATNSEVLFKNVKQLGLFVKLTLSSTLIDLAVYREGLFRCVHSGKPRELTRLLKPITDYDDETQLFILNHKKDFELIQGYEDEVDSEHSILPVGVLNTANRNNLNKLSDWLRKSSGFYIEEAGFKSIKEVSTTKFNEKINAYITEYKAFCPYKKDFHTSNYTRVILGESHITVKCYKRNCDVKVFETPQNLKVFFDTQALLPIVCNVFNTKDKGVSPLDIQLASEGIFKAPASNLCEIADALSHNLSSDGYKLDTINSVFDFGTDFPIFNIFKQYHVLQNNTFNFGIKQTKKIASAAADGEQYYKVDTFNFEQTDTFNNWLHYPCRANFFLFFRTLPYVLSYTNYDDKLYRFNGAIWTQSKVKEQFSDDTLHLINFIIANTTEYKDDKFLWPFLKKMMKELTDVAANKYFNMLNKVESLEEKGVKFDANLNIIPFKNGVYDLVTKCFRNHKSEDYSTKTLAFDFDETINNQALDLFFEQIMPIKDERDYLLYTLATLLYSNTSNDHLYFFIGKGCNGKSLLLKLVQLTLGPFAKKVSENMFSTHVSTPGQARPELIELKNAKVAILTDPKINTLCSSTVKNLAGNESVVARALYSKTQEAVVVNAKFIISMNTFPTFTENDNATRRRLRFIMFHSSFVAEPKQQDEFLVDEKLCTQVSDDTTWVQAFMNKLLAIDIAQPVIVPNSFKKDLVYVGNIDLNTFLLENLKQKMGCFVTAKEIITAFTDEVLHTKSRKYKQYYATIHNFILITFPLAKLTKTTIQGELLRGWPGLCIITHDY